MAFRSILDSLKSRPAVAGVRRSSRRPTSRLRVEALEDRSIPSAYVQTNLASDVPGQAQVHDPELVDAWGLSINPNGTFWPSARATDVSTVYSGDVTPAGGTFQPFIKRPLTVTIPGGAPTGQVFNGSSDTFIVSAGGRSAPARFIFASETGHITAWNPTVPTGGVPQSRDAFIMASTPGAVYTGLAIDNLRNGNFIYAVDFAGGKIDVFDRNYAPTTLAGNFTDPEVPADYSPFNIWELGGKLYVAYAKQENGDALPDGGHGFVSVFDLNGNLVSHLVDDSHLKEPWGLALAPADFGEFSNTLLVANTANGKINAYDPTTGDFLGRLADPSGEAIHIDGLWALHFGNGTVSGDRNALYFTAAPDKHEHGLFGSLRVAPPAVTAAESAPGEATRSLRPGQVKPLLNQALARWETAGIDTSGLDRIDIRVADLGGRTLGRVDGGAIWLDDNAAGWGWFVDKTPRNDSEFTRRGNQGERNRMDLLTVLTHEVGHLLGYDHTAGGVMQETLDAGVRRTVGAVTTTAGERPGAAPTLFVWNLDGMGLGDLADPLGEKE